MYITENQSLGESVLFLLSARSTLAEMVEDSGHEDAGVMIEFLINEASDYEIISLIVEGVVPDEKYNEIREAALFSVLKENVLANTELVSEMVGAKTFSDFMTKVDSVYPQISTAGPMLEFFSAQHPEVGGALLLSEQGAKQFYQTLAKGEKAKSLAKTGPQSPMSPGSGAVKAGPELGGAAGPTGHLSKKNLMGADKGPGDHEFVGGDYAVPKETSLAQAGSQIRAWIHKGEVGAGEIAAKISKFAQGPEGLALGGAALATLLGYAAAKTYRRFFSKAAGACRGMSGAAKTDCMGKFRGRALMAQAADLQRGMASCGKSKNPSACKASVSGKIERLKAKARKASAG